MSGLPSHPEGREAETTEFAATGEGSRGSTGVRAWIGDTLGEAPGKTELDDAARSARIEQLQREIKESQEGWYPKFSDPWVAAKKVLEKAEGEARQDKQIADDAAAEVAFHNSPMMRQRFTDAAQRIPGMSEETAQQFHDNLVAVVRMQTGAEAKAATAALSQAQAENARFDYLKIDLEGDQDVLTRAEKVIELRKLGGDIAYMPTPSLHDLVAKLRSEIAGTGREIDAIRGLPTERQADEAPGNTDGTKSEDV